MKSLVLWIRTTAILFFLLPRSQMHRRQKKIIAKLKSLLSFMRIFSPRRKVNVYQISNPCLATRRDNLNNVQLCPKEMYLPGHLWDALDPAERFASVADLCAHIGDQLPIQVVKLIARDVLRGLEDFHNTRGIAHNSKFLLFFFFKKWLVSFLKGGLYILPWMELYYVFLDISPNNILLSPTDLKSLISHLRAETQTSLRPSELSVGDLFDGGFVFPAPANVFRLSSTDNWGRSLFEPSYTFFFLFFYLCNKIQKIIDDRNTCAAKHWGVLKNYLALIVERILICGHLDVL